MNFYIFYRSHKVNAVALVSIPLGSGNTDPRGNKMYNVGGGGELGFEIDLSTVWPNPLGLYYFPLSRLFLRTDTALGVYLSSNEKTGNSDPGFFWRLGGEIGYRLTSGFTLAANLGWRQYQVSGNR